MSSARVFLGLLFACSAVACSAGDAALDACPAADPLRVSAYSGGQVSAVAGRGDTAFVASIGGIYEVDIPTNHSSVVAAVGAVMLDVTPSSVFAMSDGGEIRRIDRGSGSVSLIGDMAMTGPIQAIAAGNGDLYAGSAAGIFRIGSDGSVEPVQTGVSLDGVDSMVLDDDGTLYVYGFVAPASGREGRILAVPPHGGAGRPIGTGGYQNASFEVPGGQHIAVDGEAVYWINRDVNGSVMRAPKSGGEPVELGEGSRYVRGILVRDGTVFVSGEFGVQVPAADQSMESVIGSPATSLVSTSKGLVYGAGSELFVACAPGG
jgi:hypothetical protein